jgi:hypothetical protein
MRNISYLIYATKLRLLRCIVQQFLLCFGFFRNFDERAGVGIEHVLFLVSVGSISSASGEINGK